MALNLQWSRELGHSIKPIGFFDNSHRNIGQIESNLLKMLELQSIFPGTKSYEEITSFIDFAEIPNYFN